MTSHTSGMRLNKYIAQSTGISRRAADSAIEAGRVTINGKTAGTGQQVAETDSITLDSRPVVPLEQTVTIMINKPPGYVVSRDGQGSKIIYELMPIKYRSLKPVGRLDKDSSGLLLLTNDGELTQQLTHPSHQKTKIYEIKLLKPLQPLHQQMISDIGIQLDDGPSKLHLEKLNNEATAWRVVMREGRNRQIRRTFESVGYTVVGLHRTHFGPYELTGLPVGEFTVVDHEAH
jgi:23S rRNA pseudouridine2605 synthase